MRGDGHRQAGGTDADRDANRGAVRFVVCAVEDLPPGTRRIVTVGSRSIGVFNVGGRFYALRNVCPHQGAPLCEGPLTGTTLPGPPGTFRYGREGEIVRCPWHGWEFDVTDGRSIVDPHAVRVRAYPVAVETYTMRVERKMVVLRLTRRPLRETVRRATGPTRSTT